MNKNKDSELLILESSKEEKYFSVWIYHEGKLDMLTFPKDRFVIEFLSNVLGVDRDRFIKKRYTTFLNKEINLPYGYIATLFRLEEDMDEKTFKKFYKELSELTTLSDIIDKIDLARIAYLEKD